MKHSQTAKLANRNIPYHKHHSQFVDGGRPRGRNLLTFLFFHEFELSLGQQFGLIFQAADWSFSSEKNCILYSLFCIFFNIIVITSIISSISFVSLLNSFYLNPQVLPVAHFSSPSCWGGRRGVSEWLPSA